MFTHLHLHTQFSLLDGACRLGNLVSRAKELGMTSLAITDHGNMYGAVDFYDECKKQGVKPIIGCEVYVAPRTRFDRDKVLDKEYNHLVLLVKNETGYKNLIKMVSSSYTEGFYFKPRVDHDLLEKYSDGLVCLSACLAGEIPQALLRRDYDEAKRVALWYNEVFDDGNYYLELQNHGLDEQKVVLDGIKRLSADTGIPMVATNDVHYVNREDANIQQVLICIATNHIIGEDTGLEFHSDNFYLKSEDEMRSIFSDVPSAVDNTQRIADMCNFDFEFGNTKLPYFETPDNEDHFGYLKRLCDEGMHRRYGAEPPKKYIDRLNYELGVINSMGYTDYYLIVRDFVAFAKSKDIPVGPGRGSGAGSIAAYCVGITDVDPMKYGLIFERFLNPERVSMPDFDIDFCYERRQEVIDYVTEKYGANHVAQIVTFGTLKARAAIRDVGRVMGMPYNAVDSVVRLIPPAYKITIQQAIDSSAQLRSAIENNDQIRELIETAKKVEGMPRNASTHAAGVVITHDPVSSYVPLATNDGLVVTQFIMTALERLGLLKMDFLGNRNLTVIDSASKAAGIDINNIPLDDKKVFALFSRGRTEGVFQFESSGMKQMLTNLKPSRFEDLIAAISLFRPGPASQIDTYIENSHDHSKIKYDTPLLEPILKETNGCMVYQEQVMEIFRALAGFSFGRADVIRRAMSKKKLDVMEQERTNFVSGCEKNNIPSSVAESLFDKMTDFASYAFNKSHAACYALVSYRCAYLKCYAPAEFTAALLTSVLDSANKVARYIAESKRLGLRLAPPDINKSMKGFTANKNTINYGLLGIKNIGNDFIDEIIKERKNGDFTDLFDFCSRMQNGHFNRRAVESLIRCGAMDCFDANRRQMLQALPSLVSNIEQQMQKTMYGQVGLFDISDDFGYSFELPDVTEFPHSELLKMEKEMTGLYLSGHPMDKYEKYAEKAGCAHTFDVLSADNPDSKYKNGDDITVCGIITHITIKQTRANKANMAFVTIEDLYGSIEVVLFPKIFLKYSSMIAEDNVVAVNGTLSVEEEKDPKLLANAVIKPTSLTEKVNTARAEEHNHSDKKHKGMFLRFSSAEDKNIKKAKVITSIFDGNLPLYFYYEDEKKYHRQDRTMSVEPNDTMINELKRLLGDKNVAVIY
ncbi:MAG: DNA polymerase III subunit alpha [Oscillospiraceae bacterium]|nr:DNA polymerase III subunit alpha [Oscillospiraceae bacterium]